MTIMVQWESAPGLLSSLLAIISSFPPGITRPVRDKSRAADDTEKSLSENEANIDENGTES